jgi:hypothetical protein
VSNLQLLLLQAMELMQPVFQFDKLVITELLEWKAGSYQLKFIYHMSCGSEVTAEGYCNVAAVPSTTMPAPAVHFFYLTCDSMS